MRTVIAAVAAALVLGLAIHGPGRAAVDAAIGTRTSMELLVFEHPDCTLLPGFPQPCRAERTGNRRRKPRRRCASSTSPAPTPIALPSNRRSRMVPTAVLMKDGREVDRIAGYWGSDNFFKMVTYIIGKAE